MDSAVYAASRFDYHAGARPRLRRALAVSALSHLLFLAALASEVPLRSERELGGAPLTVRLEPPPRIVPDRLAVAEPELPTVRRWLDRRAGIARGEELTAPHVDVPATTSAPAPSLALPQVPDPTVYAARDLDSYPRPLVPLDTARLEDHAPGKAVSIRLELVIDERGIVNDVVLAGPGPAGFLETETRAMLAAARFIPARKDGRAVKSRVLLSVSFGREKREP